MTNLRNFIAASVVAVLLSIGAFAQQQGSQTLTSTTLGAAVTTTYGTSINLASLTNVTATDAIQTVLWVDNEAMAVTMNGVPSSGTSVTVTRGAYGTIASTHASGALVYVTRPNLIQDYDPTGGGCTRGSGLAAVLPWIDVRNGNISDCLGGSWATSQRSRNPQFEMPFPDSGGTAYTSLNSTGTTLAATTMYCTEVNPTSTKLVTGIGVLNGTTVGTDKHLVVLYDSSGNLLANSATAGATTSGVSTFQKFAFTSQYMVLGGN